MVTGKAAGLTMGASLWGPSLVPNVGVPSMIKPVVTAVSTVCTEMPRNYFLPAPFNLLRLQKPDRLFIYSLAISSRYMGGVFFLCLSNLDATSSHASVHSRYLFIRTKSVIA